MKDILVPLDTTDICKLRLDAALNLADRFDSHVTGFYEERSIDYVLYGESYSAAFAETLEQQLEQENKAVTDVFNDCVKTRAAKCTLKIEKPARRRDVFAQANISDLVVAGQLDPEKHIYGVKHHPEHFVMDSGKPVLIVPYIGFPQSMGKNIMIAWDQSKEASRAVHDAMPLLRKAENVHVFSVVDKKVGENEVVAADIAEHLSRHDVNVNTQPLLHADVPVAETLLSRAADADIDLIVMGAYGHSRLREYTLGGTTRTILESMTIPVLMTH